MRKVNKGHIVTIDSVAGFLSIPGQADYNASKHAAFAFDEALRTELIRSGYTGITTTNICPYFINTGMFDKVKVSPLIPILKRDFVVKRIINAIRQEERVMVTPTIC